MFASQGHILPNLALIITLAGPIWEAVTSPSKEYTYDDVPGDVELVHFNLTEDDLVYKVGYLLVSLVHLF